MRLQYQAPVLLALSLMVTTATEGRGQDKMTPAPVTAKPEAPTTIVTPSEVSKMLADKAFIATGAGLTGVSGSKGDWSSKFAADVSLGYQVMPGLAGGNLYGTFRFAPVDVTAEYQSRSHSGVIEMYNFGALWEMAMTDFKIIATGELSLLSISLSSQDLREEEESLEDGSVEVILGGGADWSIFDKVKGGPRVYVGFGDVSYYQVGGAVSFVL